MLMKLTPQRNSNGKQKLNFQILILVFNRTFLHLCNIEPIF